jgi:hypothetical protein
MEVVQVGGLAGAQPLSRDEIRERAFERQMELISDSQAFTRSFHYLQHTRASKKRAGRDLTWRDAEAALHGRAGTLIFQYERAQARLARKAAA